MLIVEYYLLGPVASFEKSNRRFIQFLDLPALPRHPQNW